MQMNRRDYPTLHLEEQERLSNITLRGTGETIQHYT
jgi:hypothetical protein